MEWLKDDVLGDDCDVMLRQDAEQYELLEKEKTKLNRSARKSGPALLPYWMCL